MGNRKKVVITGIAGFLGSHLADKFLAENWRVFGIDNLTGGYVENIPDGARWFMADLEDRSIIDSMVWKDADLVIHAAALAHEGLSVFSPALIVEHTLQATVNAVTAAVKHGAKRFVFLSSMARYGDLGELFTEEMECKPQDPYGIAKLSAEKLVQNICETHGVDWTVIVPHSIIGSRQKYDDPFRNVASIFTNRMLQGKQPIIYGDGEQTRSFTFVRDVVEPLYLATQLDEAVGEVINVGPDKESTTVNQLAREIAKILRFDLDPVYLPDRPREVKHAHCSADKARTLLGYNEFTSFSDGVAELVNWIREQGAKEFEYHLPLEIVTDATPRTWSERLI